MSRVALVCHVFAAFITAALVTDLRAQTTVAAPSGKTTGVLTGYVSNQATGKFLEGAAVTISETGRTEITDATGRFSFIDLPAGTYTVGAFYTGLDAMRATVTVGGGQRVELGFDLVSEVYELEKFIVISEREGNAASITRQRNADSVKHVVSMDAFGNLPNDNAGDLLLRLPGISGLHDLDGNVAGVMIRGTARNLNMVMVDGNLMASNFGDTRHFSLRSISGALFDEIEVTKAPTPDMPADSIGGVVNFKSASPLDRKGNRRISYGASFRWAPTWVENVPIAYDHPIHPTLKLNWQEVFSLFGKERNLGLSFNAFYSENANGAFTGQYAFQSTLDPRAFLYDYRSRDIYNNRKQKSVSMKMDYRLSPSTRVNFSVLLSEDDQPFNYWYTARAVTSQTIATINSSGQPTGTGTILPDYTENVTTVRGLNNSQYVIESQLIGTVDEQLNLNLGAKQQFGRLSLNYDAALSRSHSVLNTGEHGNRPGGGLFTASIRNVGWIVDRSASEEYPLWTQTEGPDISNPNAYVPGTMTRRNNSKNIDILTVKGDAKYELDTKLPTYIKAGVSHRGQKLWRYNADRRWNPVGATAGSLASLVDLDHVTHSEEARIGKQIPFIDPVDIVKDMSATPSRWAEDLYYGASRPRIGNDRVSEDISAGFMQGQVTVGKLKALAGVRYERTSVLSAGYVPSLVQSTAAQRAADPIGSALADNSLYLTTKGSYDNWFPGVYLTYNISKNLILRGNWSNSIGRPPFTSLVPNFSVNDDTQVVNVNNAALGPQTSENWDLGIEYYFEPVGLVSANVFRKNLSDFIVTGIVGTIGSGANNGFGGDYAGYELRSTFNGGEAKINGFELAYQQRLEFLPGPLSGLSVFANYTRVFTSGDYGSDPSAPRSTTDVVEFVPESINAGMSYSHRGFGARVMWNKTGRYLNSYNANPAQLRYNRERTMLDASISYQSRHATTFFVDVRNITNTPRSWERAGRVTDGYIYFTAVNFGIKKEF